MYDITNRHTDRAFVYFFYIEKIKELFSRYRYEVHHDYNLNKEEILDKVHELACKSNSCSLICFISSNGDQTSLCCPNGEYVQIIDILKQADTKELENCPKVFFFDACRKYYFYSVNLNPSHSQYACIDIQNA